MAAALLSPPLAPVGDAHPRGACPKCHGAGYRLLTAKETLEWAVKMVEGLKVPASRKGEYGNDMLDAVLERLKKGNGDA